MTKCHQCDSEVADNDAFCPHCGISLAPVAIPSAVEDEFASTIIMPTAGSKSASQPVVQQAVHPAEQESPVQPETTPPADVQPESENEPPTLMADPIPIAPEPAIDYDNVPTPPALEELERSAAAPEPHAPEVGHIEHFSQASEPEMRSEPPVAAPEPQMHPPAFEPESAPAAQFESSAALEPEYHPAEPAPVEEAAETDIQAPIAPPSDALETPEPAASMFDSVRIMDDRYTPTNARPSEPEPAPPERKASAGLAKSHTSSGMGMVDTDGRRAAKLKPLDEGVVLNNRYEIVRKIGGGGMGAVYLASDNNLGGVLRAVKEMVQAHIEEEQQVKAIEDFKRESMILSRLDHPSIPTIYDYFFDEEEGRFYLVMKYISGGDLAARLRAAPEGRIDEKTVTEWSIQIADVLDYLHNQEETIVYRDLKPSNIMIDGNSGRVMLIDFGIARAINQKQEKGVTAVGTMGYAPPELFSGNVEPRSDIYSLGSTMFHLLTGADPQSNPLLIFDFQKNPRPRQINSQLSDQIERFMMRSVEYNADARFESAAEVRQVLTDHLANLKAGSVTFGVKAAPESVSLANQPVFCGFCGQRIVATDLFCAFCGAKQPIAQQGVHSEIYGRGAQTAQLVIEGTSELQSPVFSLEKNEILIGRRDPMSNIFPEVDLSKYDPQTKISRRHARIWREGHTFLLEDLGSSNGTVLVPIVHDQFRLAPRQPHPLTNGDKIRVGDTTLHFVVG
jgi:serine/threonine protein kinase